MFSVYLGHRMGRRSELRVGVRGRRTYHKWQHCPAAERDAAETLAERPKRRKRHVRFRTGLFCIVDRVFRTVRLAYLNLTLAYSKGQLGSCNGVSPNILAFLFSVSAYHVVASVTSPYSISSWLI